MQVRAHRRGHGEPMTAASVLYFPDDEMGKVPRHARCRSPNHKGHRRDVLRGECTSACAKCGRFTCSVCEGTDDHPELCDACWAAHARMLPQNACYRCGKTEQTLEAEGHRLYFCEAKRGKCPNQCCPACSETRPEPDTNSGPVVCLACSDDSPEEP